MKLLASVLEVLAGRGVDACLVGAAGMAARGVARSTVDLDLLVTDPTVLEPSMWQPLVAGGVEADVRRGDADDPLVGLVRLKQTGERPVDVIVGRWCWQAELVGRAEPLEAGGLSVPLVRAADLVLLKLYAGGPQDAWDVQSLLADDDGRIAAEVDRHVERLPREAVRLWSELRGRSGDR